MFRQNRSKRQIALNIQTTGFEARHDDRIIEIAAIEYRDGIATGNKFVSLVNIGDKKIPSEVSAYTRITDDMLRKAPPFVDVAKRLLAFIQHDELIVHNAVFVTTFLDVQLHELNSQWASLFVDHKIIDVMEVDQKLFPKRLFDCSHALTPICHRAEINTRLPHRAENRARITMGAFLHLNSLAEKRRGEVTRQDADRMLAESREAAPTSKRVRLA